LRTLRQCIDQGERLESLRQVVVGWRANALRVLVTEDDRTDVDTSLEVSVDARLSLLGRPDLLRHLEDLEDAADDAGAGSPRPSRAGLARGGPDTARPCRGSLGSFDGPPAQAVLDCGLPIWYIIIYHSSGTETI
jgi:hypothetical protein